MITKRIKYIDFNDVERTEDFMFAMSKTDMILLFAKYGDVGEHVKRLAKKDDKEEFFRFLIDDIISKSYGVRTDDGASFKKDPEAIARFRGSPALDELLIELLEDDSGGRIMAFIEGIAPSDLRAKVAQGQITPGIAEYVKEHSKVAAASDTDSVPSIDFDDPFEPRKW